MTALLEAPLRHASNSAGRERLRRRAGGRAPLGRAARLDHCAYVTWSTGVGMGLCVDGRVLRGKNGNAGHGGHMFVSDNDDALCGCGNVGDVEALVAGNAVARRFGADAATLLQRAQAGDAACAAQTSTSCAA
jgi:glucokinase